MACFAGRSGIGYPCGLSDALAAVHACPVRVQGRSRGRLKG